MATNTAFATYTEVIDLQTTPDSISVIGIHTPQGISPYKRLKGFFQQFRKYRYNGITSLTLVNAAQLPIDPLGLTGQPGTTDLMDPRDALNPILFHGCHGDNLTAILDEIYTAGNYTAASGEPASTVGSNVAPSADEYKHPIASDISNYYSKLTDSSWKKFGIQSGVKLRNLRPLVHKVAMNMPLLPGLQVDHSGSSGSVADANEGVFGAVSADGVVSGDSGTVSPFNPYSLSDSAPVNQAVSPTGLGNESVVVGDYVTRPYRQEFTNGMTSLGWLPTSTLNNVQGLGGLVNEKPKLTILPKLFCGVLIMPPAYNVQQFFRCIISHSFSFRDFTSSIGLMDPAAPDPALTLTSGVPYYNWIDYGDTLDGIGAKSEVVSEGVA